jgi:hypothetical protein
VAAEALLPPMLPALLAPQQAPLEPAPVQPMRVVRSPAQQACSRAPEPVRFVTPRESPPRVAQWDSSLFVPAGPHIRRRARRSRAETQNDADYDVWIGICLFSSLTLLLEKCSFFA